MSIRANMLGPSLLVLMLVGCGTDENAQPEPAPSDDLPTEKVEAAELTNAGKGDFSLDICERRNLAYGLPDRGF